jgi:hypothetical protein
MLVDLRSERKMQYIAVGEMNHHVECTDIFSQQVGKIGDGNTTVAAEQKLIALQVLHLQNVGE